MVNKIVDGENSINIINIKIDRPKTFLTISELAHELSCSESTIHNLIRDGKLIQNYHFSKPNGGKILFYFDAIIEYFKPKDFTGVEIDK